MEDLGGGDQEFISEQVIKAIDDAIYASFGIKENDPNQQITTMYTKDKVNLWCSKIIDESVRGLSKLNKPFKYCITCIIQQTTDAGMSVNAAAYYDNNTDGFVNCQKEINDIVVLVSVFAMGI